MKQFIFVIIYLGLFSFSSFAASMGNYCYTPPFISSESETNVMLAFDNSGSMNDLAYQDSDDSFCYDDNYDASETYYGLYTNDVVYSYDAINGFFEEYTAALACEYEDSDSSFCIHQNDKKYFFKGNFLNWLTMSKMDLVKKALVGGKYNAIDSVVETESRGCVGKGFYKMIPGSGVTFGVRGSVDADGDGFFEKGNTVIDVLIGEYDYEACEELIENLSSDNPNLGQMYSQTQDCVGVTKADAKQVSNYLAPYNHSLQVCWGIAKFDSLTITVGEIRSMENDCTKVLDEIISDHGFLDWSVLEAAGSDTNLAYVCSDDYVGKCFDNTGTFLGSDACIETELLNFCSTINTPPVIDPTTDLESTGETGNLPAIAIDSGALGQLGEPVASLISRKSVSADPTGVLDEVIVDTKLGLAHFNYDGTYFETSGIGLQDGGLVAVDIDANSNEIIDNVSAIEGTTYTPVGEMFYDVTRYFRGMDSAYDASVSYTTPIQKFSSCQTNMVIFMSDGESTFDKNLPGSCYATESFVGSSDTLLTDVKQYLDSTEYGSTGTCSDKNKYEGTDYAKAVAYWAHTNDILTSSTDYPGNQTLNFITVSLFGNTASDTLLQNIAKFGSFNDENSDGTPDIQSEWDTDGDNLPDNYIKINSADELESKIRSAFQIVQDTTSSGSSISTVSTETRDANMLFQGFYYPKFYEDPDNESGPYINWIGDIRTYFVDDKGSIREDSNSDNKLSRSDDSLLIFQFISEAAGTKAFKVDDDSPADSIPDQCVIDPNTDTQYNIFGLNALWSAAKKFLTRDDSTDARKIMYVDGSTAMGTVVNNNFTTGVASSLKPYWDLALDADAQKIIKYARGYDNPDGDNTFRQRQFIDNSNEISSGVYKLGDIINSSPTVIKPQANNIYHVVYEDTTYYNFIKSSDVTDRSTVVFVGANDGMIHAFKAGEIDDSANMTYLAELTGSDIGKEIWALIPQNALPYLAWYHQESSECHVPKVDYRFQLVDMSVAAPAGDTKTSSSWRSVLIGTMGFGGKSITCTAGALSSSIFAIDVTDPESAKFMWEKQLPDNTLTTSLPGIIREGEDDKNGDWYVILGSGPLDPKAKNGDFVASPQLFAIDVRTGNFAQTSSLTVGSNMAVGEVKALDVDHDYRVDGVVFGTYAEEGATVGGLHMLHLKDSSIGDGYEDIDVVNADDIEEIVDMHLPVFAMPEEAMDNQGKLWLYFGTGRFFNHNDKVDTNSQYIVGWYDRDDLWKNDDEGSDLSLSFDSSNFHNSTNLDVFAQPAKIECFCLGVNCDETVSITGGSCSQGSPVVTETMNAYVDVTLSDGNTTPSVDDFGDALTDVSVGTTVNSQKYLGWYLALNTRERVYTKPFVAGGIVDVLSYEPPGDVCAFLGDTNLQAVYYRTGTAYGQPMFLSPDTDSSTYTPPSENKITIVDEKHLGKGSPPIGEGITALPPDGEDGQFTKMIQTSVGAVLQQKQKADGITNKLLLKVTR